MLDVKIRLTQSYIQALPAPSSYVSASSFRSISPQRYTGGLGVSVPRSIPGRFGSPVPTTTSQGSGSNPYGTPRSFHRNAHQSYGATSDSAGVVAGLFDNAPRNDAEGSKYPNEDSMENGVLSESDTARLVSEHLVTAIPTSHRNSPSSSDFVGSVSHSLLGGATTRDIYQWKEKHDRPTHLRRKSEPLVFPSSRDTQNDMPDSGRFQRASDLNTPGMFRRHFIHAKAENEGKSPPNMITSNFIDFLALYGFYGGDVYPSSDEEEEEGEDVFPPLGPSGSGVGDSGDIETPGDSTPLLGRSRTPSVSPIQGTSEKKAFFMLLKAFVGTGVLFLPKAFANGGMGFSIILMCIIGFLTLHCMLLLVETSRELGGSFGDLGEKLYGPRVRKLVLASIAISQVNIESSSHVFHYFIH